MRRAGASVLGRVGPEAEESGAWIEWFELQYPEPFENLTHLPNERMGKLDRIIQALLGTKKGAWDYVLAWPASGWPGMWLEFKAKGRPPSALSADQRAWGERMNRAGFFTAVCFGVDQAIASTRLYLSGQATEADRWRDTIGTRQRGRT